MDDASTRNNDCYFYYYSSCNKGEACSFRHEPAAMGNEEVCSLWKEGRCFRRVCSYRHMDINVDRRNTACYWESQPGGCQKPHCPFMHQNSTSLHQDGQDNYASRFVSPTIQSSNQPHTFNTQLTPSDKTLTSHERFSGGQGQFISPPSLHGFVGPCQATDRATLLPTPVDYKAGGDSQKSFNPDNIRAIPYVETIAAPQAEKIIITPCEEESDADSINGSPRKALLGTRKDTDCKSQNSSNLQQGGGDMDFKVKSLDELKKEKVRILEELQKEQKKHPDRSGHHKKSSQPEKKSLSVPAKPATHHGRPTKHDVPMKRVHITSTGDDAPSDPKHKVIKLNTGTRTKPSKPAEAVEKSDEKLVIKSLEEIQREKALKSMRDNMARKAMEARVNRDKRNQSDSIASSVDGEIKPSEQSFPQDAPQRNIVISTDAEFRRDLASRLGKQLTDIDEKTQVFDEDDVCDSGADSKGKQGETTGEFAGPTSEVKVVVCEPKAKKIKLKKHPKDAAVKEHGNRVRVVARETDTDTVVSVKPKIIRLLGKSKSETEDRKGKKKQIKHGDKRTAIELYKPPGIARQVETAKKPLVVKLKPQFSENEESTLSIGNSSSKKKDWGVKTFSEILHEKRLRRTKNTEMDTDSSESNSQETTSEQESRELKPPKQLVSPVNFTRDDKTSEIEKKPVAVPHKKRVIWSTRSTDADNKCKKAQKPVLSRIKFDKVESESDTSRKPIVFDLDEPKKDIPDIPNTRRLKLSVLGSVHKRLGKTKTVPPAAEVLAPTPESSLEVPVTCKKVPVTCKSGKKRSPGVRHDDSLLNSTFDLNTPTAGKKTVSKLQSKALGTEDVEPRACVASPKTADVRRKSAGSSNIRSESKPRAAPPTTAISSMADDLDNLFEDELQSFLSDMNGPEASVGKASKIEVEDDDALLMEMEELLA